MSSVPEEGGGTELFAANAKTPITNCNEEMLDELERRILEEGNRKSHGLIASRVVVKSGDEEMYFVSPIKTDRWRAYIMAAINFGYTVGKMGTTEKMIKEKATEKMIKEKATEFAENIMKAYNWKEPKQQCSPA